MNEERMNGVRVVRVRNLVTLLNTPITPAMTKEIIKQNAHKKFDVFHTHTPPPLASYLAAKAAKKTKTPLVLTYHCDMEIPVFFGRAAVALYQKTLGRSVIKSADKIIVTTESYAQTSRDLWNLTDVSVIPNAVDTQRFSPSIAGDEVRKTLHLEDAKVALYVGRLVHHKGLEQFIASAEHTPENVKHVIAGDGPLKEKLKALATEYKVDEKVLFVGKIPDEVLPRYYAACDVLVLPSVSRLEAFGIVALEAMACAKPVIVSDIPGVRELIIDGKEGFVARPLDANDLALKITALLSDEAKARRMGAAARERVEARFSLERVVGQIEDVYASVAQ
jgi:glycosyltransferase involved in cell wall biosynthesis